MRGHSDLIKELAEKGIGIEMCPISNLQTKAVAGTEEYPIREFLNGGLKVTVNTDNRTVSDTTMTKELEFIQKTYGIRDDEILCLMKNAADVAFATDSVKDKLYRMMGKLMAHKYLHEMLPVFKFIKQRKGVWKLCIRN